MEENENQNPIQNENTENFAQVPPVTPEQNPVQSQDNFNFSGDNNTDNGKKKKKGMGPLKGVLIALVIAILVILLGLLIRMVIAGDNDYFKPFKQIFGIEDKKEPKTSNKVDSGSSKSSLSGERYTLLVSEAENESVGHYRMTIDIEEFFGTMLDLMNSSYNQYKEDSKSNLPSIGLDNDSYYDDSDDYTDGDSGFYDDEEDSSDSYYRPTTDLRMIDNEETDLSDDEIYSDDRFRSNVTADEEWGTDYNDPVGTIDSMVGQFSSMLSAMGDQVKDLLSGEVYLDFYYDGNEVVQIVLGVDYGNSISKIYDFMLENADDDEIEEMENQGITSAEDFADYIVDQIKSEFDIDELFDEMETSEDSAEFLEVLDSLGLTVDDLKDILNIHFDRGIAEFYITGSREINDVISEYIESEEFDDYVNDVAQGQDLEIDKDNVFESVFESASEINEYEDYGISVEKIN